MRGRVRMDKITLTLFRRRKPALWLLYLFLRPLLRHSCHLLARILSRPRRAQIQAGRGKRYRIVSVDPCPLGGSSTILSPQSRASWAFITWQQSGIRWSLPGYPPTRLCSSPAFISANSCPVFCISDIIPNSPALKSSAVGILRPSVAADSTTWRALLRWLALK